MANHSGDESGFWRDLLLLGRRYALRRGLTGEDAEDCAVEFTLYVLTRLSSSAGDETLPSAPPSQNPVWLHQRAKAYTRSFQRAALTRSERHRSLTLPDGKGEEIFDTTSASEAALLRAEFWSHVSAALDDLEAVPRQLLIRRQMRGESMQALAAVCGRSVHAVEQTLWRARRQMQRTLARRGCDETMMREYIAAFTPLAAPEYAVVRGRA